MELSKHIHKELNIPFQKDNEIIFIVKTKDGSIEIGAITDLTKKDNTENVLEQALTRYKNRNKK